jgi:phage head maturation protease
MTFAKPNKNGIPFKAQIPKVSEEGLLKDRIDLAIQSLKYKLVKAVSIGFKALEWSWMEETGGIHFQEWEWLELSLVTIPANPEAVLDTAKSIDRVNRAALGIKDTQINDYLLPGATGLNKGYRRPIQLIPAKR